MNLIAYCQDLQDGSFRVAPYQRKEELAEYLEDRGTSLEEVESEEDPYENGVIRYVELDIEIVDGEPRLVREASFCT